jgi:hypothetical protein
MSQTKAQLIDTLVASLLPASDSSVDIGSNAVRFANIYGDTLYGDGSNLTGITSTTINNNAVNRLITGSGSANTLNGNSDLLWNGSRLDIDTGGTEDALRIGNSAGTDTFIRLGSIGTTPDTHAVIKYDKDDNYLSLLVSGESHGNGGMLIANGGAVSLSAGTSPLAKLHVKDDVYVKGSSGDGSTGIQIRSGSSAISGQHEVRTGGGLGNMLIVNAAGATGLLQVQTNGTEKLRIDSDGRVLIGTTTAAAILTLDNTGQTTQSLIQCEDTGGTGAHAHIVLKNTTGTVGTINTVSDNLEFRVDDATVFSNISGTENARITSNGILRIGCTAQPSTTVSGAQFDAGGKALRVSVGEGTSGTIAAGISLIGGGSNTNIAASASYGASLNLINSNNTDGNSNAVLFMNSNNLATSSVVGETTSHSSRNGELAFLTSSAAAPAERVRINSSGLVIVKTNGINLENATATNSRTYSITNAAGTTGWSFGNGVIASAHQFVIYDNSAGAARMIINSSGHVLPGSDNAQDLGSSSKRWQNVYTTDLKLSNEGSQNDVDSTWGNYTIQEGHEDLFLINHRTGKKFKFNLTEVA